MTARRHSCLRVSRLVTLLSLFSRRAVSGSFSNLLIGKCQNRRLITHDYTDPTCPDVVRMARLAQSPEISTGAFKDVRSRPDRRGSRTSDGGFDLTCEDTERTTRYMAVSRLSMVPVSRISPRRPLLRKWRLGETEETDRWTPTEETDRRTGNRGGTRTVSQLQSAPLIRLRGRK